ncbi:MAG: TIGR03088 family PEP-CTERM/XrtA system glycosyltransferase [Rubrivivax sp.]|nr:TIGR03088 family PEP-CTERM/XrtA system glycosyltransferase [Rubrivivax sp.]
MAGTDGRPLVAHVVYRFAVGGLENGVVNLINRLPHERWRHVVLSLTDVDPGFAARITRDDVRCIPLAKPPGQGFRQWPRWTRLLRELRPDLVHTRNLAALEMQPAAWAAGVRARVHGEHGRDIEDMHGTSRRHRWMRRLHRPFVQHWVALSGELEGYLHDAVGVPAARVTRICNGVDEQRFAPAPGGGRQPIAGSPFNDPRLWLLGTVGRMQTVKAQPLLVQAFVQALREQPALAERTRLVLVGDGPLRAEAEAQARSAGIAPLVWFAGERSDVPDVMRGLDCFVLPSLAEGISNTILEAMASGLPVLATRVGGNAELVAEGQTGEIVPPGDVAALAAAIPRWAADPARALAAGQAGRRRVGQQFSLSAMVAAYEGVYRRVLGATTTE